MSKIRFVVLFLILAIFILIANLLIPFFNKSENISHIENPERTITAPVYQKIDATPDQIQYFKEVAFGNEYGTAQSVIRKWIDNSANIYYSGNFKNNDLRCLENVVNDFNTESSETLMNITSNDNADIMIHFAPESTFESILPEYEPVNMGYFWLNFDSGFNITSSQILIDSLTVNDAERCHLIREELTQSMGLMNDSPNYPDSIFYTEWTSTQEYSAYDKKLIKLLYGNTGVKSGQSITDIDRIFSQSN